MTVVNKDLAGSALAGEMKVTLLFAGERETPTTSVIIAQGSNIGSATDGIVPKYTVVAKNTTTNKYVPHNPAGANSTNVAIGITLQEVNTLNGDAEVPIYLGGVFNHKALVWHATLTTLEQRKNVFLRTAITIDKLQIED